MAMLKRSLSFYGISPNVPRLAYISLNQNQSKAYCSSEANEAEDVALKKARKLEKIRDISGLPYNLKCKLSHVNKLPKSQMPQRNIRLERDELRKQYAMLGHKSGIDPGILWDTKEEYREKLAEDLHSRSLEEAMRQHKYSEETWQNAKHEKIENVKLRMEVLMPEFFDQIYQNQQKALEESAYEIRKGEKLNQLLEEAKDYLGYEITNKDPEFVALMEKLKLQEKEERRKKRKTDKLMINKPELAQPKTDEKDKTPMAAAE